MGAVCSTSCKSAYHPSELMEISDAFPACNSIKEFSTSRAKIIGTIGLAERQEELHSPVSGRKCVAFNVEVRRNGTTLMAHAVGNPVFMVFDDTRTAVVHTTDELGAEAGEHGIYGHRRMFDMKPDYPAAQSWLQKHAIEFEEDDIFQIVEDALELGEKVIVIGSRTQQLDGNLHIAATRGDDQGTIMEQPLLVAANSKPFPDSPESRWEIPQAALNEDAASL